VGILGATGNSLSHLTLPGKAKEGGTLGNFGDGVLISRRGWRLWLPATEEKTSAGVGKEESPRNVFDFLQRTREEKSRG